MPDRTAYPAPDRPRPLVAPDEVIAHALSLLEAEEDGLLSNKEAINERLEHSMAQAAQGPVLDSDEAARLLDERILHLGQ